MSEIKIAVIGTGGISECHINGYLKNPDTELYALCDINKERVTEKAKRYGVPLERTFTDKDEMLRVLPEIDAVSVCTWNSAHAECTIAALNAGKHVLCEKPMAMNAQQAQAMLDAARKNKRILMIGFVRRHGRDAKLVKDFIDRGSFGDIYYAKAMYMRRNGSPGGWFSDKSRSGGGPVIDLGVHVIDLTRYLMGNPKPVSVFAATNDKLKNRPGIKKAGVSDYKASDVKNDDIYDVEDFACAMIRFDNGAVVNLETSFSINGKPSGEIDLFGTKAGCNIDPEVHIYNVTNDYLTDCNFYGDTSFDFSSSFEAEVFHYVDCIMGRAQCIAPGEDGLEIMKILDAIYESAKTGHEVIL